MYHLTCIHPYPTHRYIYTIQYRLYISHTSRLMTKVPQSTGRTAVASMRSCMKHSDSNEYVWNRKKSLSKALSLAVCSFLVRKLLQSLLQVETTPAFLSLNGGLQLPEAISRPPATTGHKIRKEQQVVQEPQFRNGKLKSSRIQGSMMTSSKMHCHSNALRSLRIDTL